MATASLKPAPVNATYSGVPTNNITKGLPKTRRIDLPGSRLRQGHHGPHVRRERQGLHGEDVPGARVCQGPLLVGRGALPEGGEVGVRRRPGHLQPVHRPGSLPARLRPLPAAHEPHGPREHRPDQPLQPDLPDLLRQRQRQRPGLRAEQGGGHRDAPAVPQGAAGCRARGPVLGRRADDPSRLLRDPARGAGHGLHPHPDRVERHQVRRPGLHGAGRPRPACTRSTSSSTVSTTTSTGRRAAAICSRTS